MPVPVCSSSQHKPLAIAPLSQSLRGHSSSLRESEALVHQALVQSWIAVAEAVQMDSEVVLSVPHLSGDAN